MRVGCSGIPVAPSEDVTERTTKSDRSKLRGAIEHPLGNGRVVGLTDPQRQRLLHLGLIAEDGHYWSRAEGLLRPHYAITKAGRLLLIEYAARAAKAGRA